MQLARLRVGLEENGLVHESQSEADPLRLYYVRSRRPFQLPRSSRVASYSSMAFSHSSQSGRHLALARVLGSRAKGKLQAVKSL